MKNALGGFKAGDISPTSPSDSLGQELAKRYVLATVAIQPPLDQALGAVGGLLSWLFSHLAPQDRGPVTDAFIRNLSVITKGEDFFSAPMADLAQAKGLDGKPIDINARKPR